MSQERTATVTAVGAINPWNGSHGTIYYHDITLSNGDSGSIGKKQEHGIKVGDQITYTIEPSANGNKIKQSLGSYGGGGGSSYSGGNNGGGTAARSGNYNRSAGSSRSFALSYAKDLVVAGAVPIDKILIAADRFNDWLEGGALSAVPAAAPQASMPTPPPEPPTQNDDEDEIPF